MLHMNNFFMDCSSRARYTVCLPFWDEQTYIGAYSLLDHHSYQRITVTFEIALARPRVYAVAGRLWWLSKQNLNHKQKLLEIIFTILIIISKDPSKLYTVSKLRIASDLRFAGFVIVSCLFVCTKVNRPGHFFHQHFGWYTHCECDWHQHLGWCTRC